MNTGISTIDRLDRVHVEIREKHRRLAKEDDVERIGTYLKVLYDISTCADGCRGGNHMFEALCGRSFNLGYATYTLLNIGLYDEARNQIRSLGELVNLVSLCKFDPIAFSKWTNADHGERVSRFGPAKIRELIASADGVVIVDATLYRQLCEQATHVTPQTIPNMHNDSGYGHIGGSVQADGFFHGVSLLQRLLYSASTQFTEFAGNPDKVDVIPLPPSVEA